MVLRRLTVYSKKRKGTATFDEAELIGGEEKGNKEKTEDLQPFNDQFIKECMLRKWDGLTHSCYKHIKRSAHGPKLSRRVGREALRAHELWKEVGIPTGAMATPPYLIPVVQTKKPMIDVLSDNYDGRAFENRQYPEAYDVNAFSTSLTLSPTPQRSTGA